MDKIILQYYLKKYITYFCLGNYNDDKLLKEYEAITTQYGIKEKIVRIVTDNASNGIKHFGSLIVPGFELYFDESLDELADEQDEDEEIGDDRKTNFYDIDRWCNTPSVIDELPRFPCYIHTLQSVISDGFKESICIKAAVAKVAGIAKFR